MDTQRTFTPHGAPIRNVKLLPVQPPGQVIGRNQELGLAHAALKGGSAVFLSGPSGIGKTALASVLSSAYMASNSGGVLWFNILEDDVDLLIARVGRAYGVNALTVDASDSGDVIQALLKQNRPLIVLDGLIDLDAVRDFIKRCASGVAMIITNESPEAGPWQSYNLQPLSSTDSDLFFRFYSGLHDALYGPDIDGLNKFLGGIPVAMELAARQLAVDQQTPAELLTALPSTTGNNSAAMIMSVVFKHLSPSSQAMLLMLAATPTGTATAELMSDLSNVPGPNIIPLMRQLVARGIAHEYVTYGQFAYSLQENAQVYTRGWLDQYQRLQLTENRAMQAIVKYVGRHAHNATADHDRLAAEMDNIVNTAAYATSTNQGAVVRQLIHFMAQQAGDFVAERGFQPELNEMMKLATLLNASDAAQAAAAVSLAAAPAPVPVLTPAVPPPAPVLPTLIPLVSRKPDDAVEITKPSHATDPLPAAQPVPPAAQPVVLPPVAQEPIAPPPAAPPVETPVEPESPPKAASWASLMHSDTTASTPAPVPTPVPVEITPSLLMQFNDDEPTQVSGGTAPIQAVAPAEPAATTPDSAPQPAAAIVETPPAEGETDAAPPTQEVVGETADITPLAVSALPGAVIPEPPVSPDDTETPTDFSIPTIEKHLEDARTNNDLPREAALLQTLGRYYADQDNVGEAISRYKESLQVYETLNDNDGMLADLDALAELAVHNDDIEGALLYATRGVNLAQQTREKDRLGRLQTRLGDVRMALGDTNAAIDTYAQAVETLRGEENWQTIGTVMMKLGGAYTAQNKPQEAVMILEQARAMFQRVQNTEYESRTATMLGTAAVALKQLPQAQGYYEQGLRLSRATAQQEEESAQLSALAHVRELQGDPIGAITNYRQALYVGYMLDDKQLQAANSFDLGRLLIDDTRTLNQAVQLLRESDSLVANNEAKRLLNRASKRVERTNSAGMALPPAEGSNRDYAAAAYNVGPGIFTAAPSPEDSPEPAAQSATQSAAPPDTAPAAAAASRPPMPL